MKCRLLSVFLLFITTMGPPTAEAFVEDPYITPAHPTPETPISVNVRMGWCHTSWDAADGATLTTVAPGQLRLVTNGAALPPGHPFCLYPPFDFRFGIGTLPAGTYTLQLLIYDEFSAPEPVGVGSVNFVVASPATIPSTSIVAQMAISALLAVTGISIFRRSYRG